MHTPLLINLISFGLIVSPCFAAEPQSPIQATTPLHTQRDLSALLSRLTPLHDRYACQQAVEVLDEGEHAALLHALVVHFRSLHQPMQGCPTAPWLRKALKQRFSPEMLLGFLRKPETWKPALDPEHTSFTSWTQLTTWILLNAEYLLEPAHTVQLEALLESAHFQETSTHIFLSSLVAVAIYSLDPSRGRVALQALPLSLDESRRGRLPLPFIHAYAQAFPHSSQVRVWLKKPKARRPCFEKAAPAVLEGWGLGGDAERTALKAFVRKHKSELAQRPAVLDAARHAAIKLGAAKLEEACRDVTPSHPRCIKLPRGKRRSLLKKYDRAKRKCLKALGRWARKS